MSRWMSAILVLILAGCSRKAPAPLSSSTPQASPAPSSASAGDLIVTGPYVHENLAVYLVRRPSASHSPVEFSTLDAAMKSGEVKVFEKGSGAQVNELEIENTSDRPCYVQAGDVVKGGQQDRAIGADFVIPPRSGRRPIPAFCVEQSRWKGAACFAKCDSGCYSSETKTALRSGSGGQQRVWQEVAKAKERNRAVAGMAYSDSSSLNEELDHPKFQARVEEFVSDLTRQLGSPSDGVGLIYAVNGVWSTADLYGYPELFAKQRPRLLRSAAQDAIGTKAESRPTPTSVEAKAFLARAGEGTRTENVVDESIKSTRFETPETVRFDCIWNKVGLHEQSLKKPKE